MANKSVSNQEVTGWVGWVYFAAFLLILNGFFQATMGLVALFNSDYYAITENALVVFDISSWGWIHLLLGVLLVSAGSALFSGRMWARVLAVIMTTVAMLGQLIFMSVYPVWSITALVLGFVIIYALTVHGSEAAEEI